MSRLIIKNLPAYVTPVRLREHLERRDGPGGVITDVKVPLKRDGTSRRFAFVGYKTENEATAAQAWFNKTFIDAARIAVEIIEGTKDAPAPRPNKRPRLDLSSNDPSSSATKSTVKQPAKTQTSKNSEKPSDPQFEQFLQVMKPRTNNGPAWANDAEPMPMVIPLNRDESEGVETSGAESLAEENDANKTDEGISDLDWMRRHMSRKADAELSPEKTVIEEKEGELPPNDSLKDSPEDIILRTSRLFLRNLAFSCTDIDLSELFNPFGEVSQIHIPIDSLTKQSKGIAYVKFAQPSCALEAYQALDGKSFQGRLLHILAAVDRKSKFIVEEGDGKKKTLKAEKFQKQKAAAGKEFNWSMLYMNSDAVLSSISDRLNISKADILNPESDNAAVKLALAETHIIQETKTYLETQGVILSSFSSRSRSDTTILVKNIPYGTTAEQIREMFEPHGKLSRVLVPPAGTIALVDFIHPDEASSAFRAIAYRRLGNSIIYLEKGPLGIFKEEPPQKNPDTATSTAFEPVTIPEQHQPGDNNPPRNEVPLAAGSTLFVKNLSFSTTTERLAQVFRHLPSFAFARVQYKPSQNRPDGIHNATPAPRLSLGYGFIGFKTPEAARKAMKSIQRYVLDGHALHVDFAGRGAEGEESGKHSQNSGSGKSRTTKMIVKNVPFEATKKDIRELFSAYGHLKSVRLPKKFDSRSRGFAFLDFASRQEAENAYSVLRHTHLLGRHLVLEWASEAEQDLDVLRQKAGVGFGEGKELPGRKRKLDLGLDGEGEDDQES